MVKVKLLLYRPVGIQEVEVPRISRQKAVRLSALRTGRLFSPGKIPSTHFCQRLSRSQDHNVSARNKSVDNDTHTHTHTHTHTLQTVKCLPYCRRFSLIFFCLQANPEMVPKPPVHWCMLLVQPFWFNFFKNNPPAVKLNFVSRLYILVFTGKSPTRSPRFKP